MKMFRFVCLALMATLSLASCVKDVTDNGEDGNKVEEVDGNMIAFTLKSAIATRSAGEITPVVGKTISLGEPVLGQNLTFEETVTSLDGIYPDFSQKVSDAPETRGTPVYTENFMEMSGGAFKGLAFTVSEMTDSRPAAAFIPDGTFVFDDYHQKWLRSFNADPWGSNEHLLFFGRLAKDNTSWTQDGVIFNSLQYSNNERGQYMTFSYRSAPTAAEQQDILFACRTIDKVDTHKGIPILFYHALTGIKFATAHQNDGSQIKTFIDKVELTGVYGYGKCTIKPVEETNGYVDDNAVYSSASAVSWDLTSNTAVDSKQNAYYQEFSKTDVTYAEGGDFGANGSYPKSFSDAGNERNLNAADGSMTFWMVPQLMSDDVIMKVTFHIQSGKYTSEKITREIRFGEALSGVKWNPGELRTYTLKANEVDVIIEDKIDENIKHDVVITNVGNVAEYVRAQIVGNWYGKGFKGEEGVALGYTAPVATAAYVSPWSLGPVVDGKIAADNFGGVFENLPGANWILGTDGFFYFTQLVDVLENTSTPLFSKFTYASSSIPQVYYIDNKGDFQPFEDVHLVMDIAVQAVEAPLKVGSSTEYEDYVEAWSRAGVTAPRAPSTTEP